MCGITCVGQVLMVSGSIYFLFSLGIIGSGGSRISRWGDGSPVGEPQCPAPVLFGENVCENERIVSRGGAPPGSVTDGYSNRKDYPEEISNDFVKHWTKLRQNPLHLNPDKGRLLPFVVKHNTYEPDHHS